MQNPKSKRHVYLEKIADLTTKFQNFDITFEIAQIVKKSSIPSELHCKVVDESGIIDAYFTKFVDNLILNSTYTMFNLSNEIVQGHMRLKMNEDSVVQKVPNLIKFKDRTNDLSKKLHKQQVIKKSNLKFSSQTGIKKQKGQKYKQNSNQKNEQKDNKEDKNQVNKIKYVLKEDKQFIKAQKVEKLKNIGNYVGKYVSVHVWVDKKARNIKDKYWMCLLADSSGGIWVQLENSTTIDGNQWYDIDNLSVQLDKKYSVILIESKKTNIKISSKQNKPIQNPNLIYL